MVLLPPDPYPDAIEFPLELESRVELLLLLTAMWCTMGSLLFVLTSPSSLLTSHMAEVEAEVSPPAVNGEAKVGKAPKLGKAKAGLDSRRCCFPARKTTDSEPDFPAKRFELDEFARRPVPDRPKAKWFMKVGWWKAAFCCCAKIRSDSLLLCKGDETLVTAVAAEAVKEDLSPEPDNLPPEDDERDR